MQKEKVLKLLEMDFKHLFLSSKGIRVRTSKDGAIEKELVEKDSGSRSYPSPEKLREIRNK